MTGLPFEIVFEEGPEDERLSAYSPALLGCFSNCQTVEGATGKIRQAIRQHIESRLAHENRDARLRGR